MTKQWKCPTCGATVTTFIEPKQAPTCRNKATHHHNREITMKEIK